MKRFVGETGEALMFILLTVTVLLIAMLLPLVGRTEPLSSPVLATAVAGQPGYAGVTEKQVTEYIRAFVSKLCHKSEKRLKKIWGEDKWKSKRRACFAKMQRKRRWRRAPELAKLILKVAAERKMDPWWLIVTARAESSFHEGVINGDVGEKGLTQVHEWALRQALKKGYDMDTSLGQLRAGADHLLRQVKKCDGSEQQMFNAYISGRCKTRGKYYYYRLKVLGKARENYPKVGLENPPDDHQEL